jgi:hypothetical protein
MFAAILGLYALWVLTAEIMRPTIGADGKFPPAIATTELESKRSMAVVVASIGKLRGDLWTDRVLVDAEVVFSTINTLTAAQTNAAHLAARQALSYAPLDSRVWLVLAALSSGSRELTQDVYELLRMSYYTGPNEKPLIDARLRFAVRSQAFAQPELGEAMRREIRAILRQAPDLRPSVIAAYREANREGRAFLERAVSEVDPKFLDVLRIR